MPSLEGGPARRFVPVTKGGENLPTGLCRGLLVGTAGTANLTEFDGTDRNDVPLQAGYNPMSVCKVRSGGTADNIWALY
jgi:hypothetical protein